MAATVYALCGVTSAVCVVLLLRGYHRARSALLLWSALCFGALAVNNLLLVLDELVLDTRDLSAARSVTAALGPLVLLVGLIWEDRR